MMMPNVLTAHEKSFQQMVIERSHEIPILVDFWAPWCAPCRVLSPILEEMASAGEGAWLLVKVNTDENQRLAQKYNVQGIPFCVLFKDGAVVDSFVGVQPKATIQGFLQKWVTVKENQRMVEVDALIRNGAFQEVRTILHQVLADSPSDERTLLAFARLELAEGNPDAALSHLEHIPYGSRYAREAAALRAHAHFAQQLPYPHPPVDELEAAVEATPNDIAARFRLGNGAALVDAREIAAEQFLWILQRDRHWNNGAARNALLDLFALWGEDAPETAHYQQQMGWVLFA